MKTNVEILSDITVERLKKSLRNEEDKSYLLEKALRYAVKNDMTQEEYEGVMEEVRKLK